MTVWKRGPGTGPHPPWKVILLDRDGVVIRDRGYLGDPGGVELIPGAAAALRRAHEAGWYLCGLSNQSGLGRGLFTLGDLAAVMQRMEDLLAADGAVFDAFHYCPHAPGEGCECRKPQPGLVREAGLLEGLDHRSWMVGDKLSDVETGLRLGIGAILVRTGYGETSLQAVRDRWSTNPPFAVVDDLPAAIGLILGAGETDA